MAAKGNSGGRVGPGEQSNSVKQGDSGGQGSSGGQNRSSLWQWPGQRQFWLLAVVGLGAGFLSGMFGVGGGIIIVPALISIVGFSPRLAAGTSLLAIVPLATVGVFSYAVNGQVAWAAALLVAAGAMVGAQGGAWLLNRVSVFAIRISFGLFVIFSAVMLFVTVPSRGAMLQLDWLVAAELVLLGLATGVLSGLLGVGGGVIVVPAMMLLFGAPDLVAKGTSLLMMIPSALSGSAMNLRRQNVSVSAALIVGVPACFTTFLGSSVAQAISPELGNALFAAFLFFVAAQTIWKAFRSR